MRPILTHQRLDFALVSIDQLVNQAAKWHYMFDGRQIAPLTVRMTIGRGWGQGPQHTQMLHAWFAHIPGLIVALPATPYDAKGMLLAAHANNNPVIILEHRWLYELRNWVPEVDYQVLFGVANVLRSGKDITLIGVSYMAVEALKASETLAQLGIDAAVIDIKTIRPLDTETICQSVEKTRFAMIIDHAALCCGASAEISSVLTERLFSVMRAPPKRLGLPDYPLPTSPSLSDSYYPTHDDIVRATITYLGSDVPFEPIPDSSRRLDQPDASFTGPF